MWPLKTILYFILFWVACIAALFNPIWGVINYMIVYQVNPQDTWWGRPLAAMGMRFSMLAAVFIFLGLFIGRKRVPKLRPVLSPWELGLLALIAMGAVSLVIGHNYNNTWSQYAFEKLWKMLVFVFILGRLATTRRNLKLALWALVVGSLYLGHQAYTAPEVAFWHGRLESVGGTDFSRTSGTAAHLAAMLPLIGTVFLITRQWKWRALAAISGALSVNAIALCRTRSAFVGLACGALVAVLTVPRVRRYRIHLLLCVGGVLAFTLTDNQFWHRMSTLTDRKVLDADPAASGRFQVWAASLRIIADHPQGVGIGNFPHTIGLYDPRHLRRSAHNSLVVCITELGIHSGVIFLLMVGGSFRYLHRSYKFADDTAYPLETKLLAYGLLVALTTYFVTALGTERFYCESFWWVLVLPLCLHRVVTREVAANAKVPKLARIHEAEENRGFFAPAVP